MSTEAFTTLELEAIGDASVDARAHGHQPGTFRRLDDRLTVAPPLLDRQPPRNFAHGTA
jgi:hypothetical protein